MLNEFRRLRLPGYLPVVMAGIGALFVSRFWVSATHASLYEAENILIQKHVKASHVATAMVAGQSTIEVANPKAREGFKSIFNRSSTVLDEAESIPLRTMVLVHGFGAGKALWLKNFDDLAKDYRVLAVDWSVWDCRTGRILHNLITPTTCIF
jgi:pimeloyl-ACP methyl ester carboxylesterase